MGRAEKEITTTNAALRELVEWLRDQRAWAGLTYRELADRVGLHATTLQRVASGSSVPQLMSVLAYARGCDALPDDARRLWQRARREQVRSGTPHRQPAPAPAYVRDFADLSAALRGLYEGACAPPLRIMAQRAGGFGALPRSSAHRIVNKQTVPHCLQQFQAFLRACEVPTGHWKEWEDAWSRAWRFEKQEDAGLNEVVGRNDSRQRDQLPRIREFADESTRKLAGVASRTLVTAAGPQYHRPLAPRQRFVPEEKTKQEVYATVLRQRWGRTPTEQQLALAVHRKTGSDHDERLDDEARQFEELRRAARIAQEPPSEGSAADPIGTLVAREYKKLTDEGLEGTGELFRALRYELISRYEIKMDDLHLIEHMIRIRRADMG